MYSSVTKVDILVRDPDTGAKIAVQTDHRDAAEIEASWDLSVLFAAVRILNARRAVPDVGRIRFGFMGEPPARMSELLRRAGADVQSGPGSAVLERTGDDREGLLAAVNASALALGTAIFERYGVQPDAEGLRAAASELSASIVDIEDETCLWTAVLELAAATFVAARVFDPALRIVATEDADSLPFTTTSGSFQLNVFGKCERFAKEGHSESPVGLLAILAESGAPEGDVVFNLRPPDWGGKGNALILPLLANAEQAAKEPLPLLAVCRDMPTTVKTFPHDTPPDEVAKLKAAAEASIAKIKVQVTKLGGGPGELALRIVHDDFYASEKVFDREFMAALAKDLGSELLTVSVPCKGRLLVSGPVLTPEQAGALMLVTAKMYDEAAPNQRLSKQLLLWRGGALVGLVSVSMRSADEGTSNRPPEPDAPQGFFKRWFGW
jgi:hypothetical protein